MGDRGQGLRLSRLFYEEEVGPIVQSCFPELRYSAALLGACSDVLGYDDEISRDHHWGPRMYLFLTEEDLAGQGRAILEVLGQRLPVTFRGFCTNYAPSDEIGVRVPQPVESGPVQPFIDLRTVGSFFGEYGVDLSRKLEPLDWLLFTQQQLLELTAGDVFYDGLNVLHRVRETLKYYPDDIWLYLLGVQWSRIAEEEAFVGRCGDAGDDLGSRLVAARLVRELMRLCFLMERTYAPYAKWFGTAFVRLACAPRMRPLLDRVLAAGNWGEREASLADCYREMARMHNAFGIAPALDPEPGNYYGRPYRVLNAGRFAEAVRAEIRDDAVRQLPVQLGSVDQLTDCVWLQRHAGRRQFLGGLYSDSD